MSAPLRELRERVAAALLPIDPDWNVHAGPVDAISPPSFVIVWPDPWLTPMTPCVYQARLHVVCCAGRVEPTPGYETLEEMVTRALDALSVARLPVVQVGGASSLEIARLLYLIARVTVAAPVALPGG